VKRPIVLLRSARKAPHLRARSAEVAEPHASDAESDDWYQESAPGSDESPGDTRDDRKSPACSYLAPFDRDRDGTLDVPREACGLAGSDISRSPPPPVPLTHQDEGELSRFATPCGGSECPLSARSGQRDVDRLRESIGLSSDSEDDEKLRSRQEDCSEEGEGASDEEAPEDGEAADGGDAACGPDMDDEQAGIEAAVVEADEDEGEDEAEAEEEEEEEKEAGLDRIAEPPVGEEGGDGRVEGEPPAAVPQPEEEEQGAEDDQAQAEMGGTRRPEDEEQAERERDEGTDVIASAPPTGSLPASQAAPATAPSAASVAAIAADGEASPGGEKVPPQAQAKRPSQRCSLFSCLRGSATSG